MADSEEEQDELEIDVDDASYRPLTEVDGRIASVFVENFLSSFFETSDLDLSHRDEARDMLDVDVGVMPDGERFLRVCFRFSGSTAWESWSGTPDDAAAIATELGYTNGMEAVVDQRYGPTGWEHQAGQ